MRPTARVGVAEGGVGELFSDWWRKKNKEEEEIESSVFEETKSLDTPSEKVLDDKEKKMIDRITIESNSLKN